MIKKLLVLLSAFALLIALAVSALLGYTVYANHAADQAASAFCETIPIGSDIGDAVASAALNNSPHRLMRDNEQYQFVFQGGIFHAGVCRIRVLDGKVTSARSASEGD